MQNFRPHTTPLYYTTELLNVKLGGWGSGIWSTLSSWFWCTLVWEPLTQEEETVAIILYNQDNGTTIGWWQNLWLFLLLGRPRLKIKFSLIGWRQRMRCGKCVRTVREGEDRVNSMLKLLYKYQLIKTRAVLFGRLNSHFCFCPIRHIVSSNMSSLYIKVRPGLIYCNFNIYKGPTICQGQCGMPGTSREQSRILP